MSRQPPALAAPVDIIVPVYRGLDETRACLESVRASSPRTAYRLIAINDAGPEPELTAWLRAAAAEGWLTLLENPENLGFVGTVNRGMALSETADVVLLNSDTEVVGDWLDRLVAAAYARPKVGSVTPFSNNATICSYPRFCEDNPLPSDVDLATLDQMFARENAGETVEIPTAVGFCMYIPRACLNDVGLFDQETFGKGYGEENDFCMRAMARGWTHLLAADTFVWHKGSVSFGAEHNVKRQLGLDTVRRLHPQYDALVHAHLAEDPARTARARVDLARLSSSPLPRILFLTHSRGGGTETHMGELAALGAGRARFLALRPGKGGLTLLEAYDKGESLRLWYRLPGDYEALRDLLRAIGIDRVHVHHMLGLDDRLMDLATDLECPLYFTAHDYYPLCPQITLTRADNRYCGEEGEDQCAACLRTQPAPGGVDIATWRRRFGAMLSRAERIIAPAASVAERYRRVFPDLDPVVAAHPDAETEPLDRSVEFQPPAPDEPLRVAVLGALSPMKGPDLLEETARLAATRGVKVEFRLIGFAYRALSAPGLKITGKYKPEDLPRLLADYDPHLVWFPAQWPETYSYTLSACLAAGLPVAATDLGAIAERLYGRPATWLLPWWASAAAWVSLLAGLREGRAPAETLAATRPPAAVPSSFVYTRDYLPTRASGSVAPRPPEWETHVYPRLKGRHAVLSRGGQMAVRALLALRSSPALAGLARRIPVSWQRRVKSWLLRES